MADDHDADECCVAICAAGCEGVAEGVCSGSQGWCTDHLIAIVTAAVAVLLRVLVAVLGAFYAVVHPVRAAVEDASLTRLAVVATGSSNGTSLAYGISLAVAVRNPNWAMDAKHAAPLVAELRFAGQRFAGVRLAEAGWKIGAKKTEVYHVVVADDGADVVPLLGSAAVAELERESAAGVFESLEMKLAGEFKYVPVHGGRNRTLDVTCPLKLPLSSTTAPAEFTTVKCT